MERLDTTKVIKDLIIESSVALTIDQLSETIPFSELGLDSLDQMSLIMEVQQHFNITIEDEQISDLGSIEKLAAYIDSL